MYIDLYKLNWYQNSCSIERNEDFLQVLLARVLYEDCMTFCRNMGQAIGSPLFRWIYNDFM